MSLSPNSTLSHYRIVSKLGEGGMGQVFLAEDTHLRRRVALKVVPPEIGNDKDRLLRFQREAFSASALNHPNIVTIYEFGADGKTHFIASEFIQGQTLRDRMSRSRLTLPTALDIAIQIASALQAAHEAGIIHRDIKPENVMIRDDGYVKVVDFGLAKLSESAAAALGPGSDPEAQTQKQLRTQAGIVIGTLAYMSPEQARGLSIDARSDIWSLGCVVYEMLTGQHPFRGETTTDLLANIIHREPPSLLSLFPDAPAELETIFARTVQKERDKRYATAKDLLVALRQLQKKLELRAQSEQSAASEVVSTTNASPVATVDDELSTVNNRRLPLAITALLCLAILAVTYFLFLKRPKQIDSIAVLPFVNESGNAEVEYLSDGMTETLIESLSHLQNVAVKARSSVFRYKGKEIDARRFGQELSVDALLTGRIMQRGDQFTLALELVDAETENVIWSHNYQSQTDLAVLQSDVVRDVSNKLRRPFTDADEKKLEQRHTENTEAYHLYLHGRYHWNKRTKESLKLAADYFQQAIQKDPNYALAYSGLADTYTVSSTYELLTPTEAYTKARTAAQRALEIDPTLSEAYATLADTRESFDWDFEGAARDYQKAISLTPNHATAHQWYGELLRKLGHFDEALAEQRRALELDPLSVAANHSLAASLFYARRYDEAIAQCERVIELDSNFAPTYRLLGWCYTMKELYTEALAQHRKSLAINASGTNGLASLAYTLAKSGNASEARKTLSQLKERQKREYIDSGDLAKVHFALKENEEAIASLQKAYEERSSEIPYLKVNPAYDEQFRSDPRFQELLRKVGLL